MYDNSFANSHEDAFASETHLHIIKEGLLIAAGLLAPLKGYNTISNQKLR